MTTTRKQYSPKFKDWHNGIGWKDKRVEGELLWPERFNEQVVAAEKRRYRHEYSAVFDQEPTPADGTLFKQSPARRYNSTVPGTKLVTTNNTLSEPDRTGQLSSPLDRYSIFASRRIVAKMSARRIGFSRKKSAPAASAVSRAGDPPPDTATIGRWRSASSARTWAMSCPPSRTGR